MVENHIDVYLKIIGIKRSKFKTSIGTTMVVKFRKL